MDIKIAVATNPNEIALIDVPMLVNGRTSLSTAICRLSEVVVDGVIMSVDGSPNPFISSAEPNQVVERGDP